MAENLKITEAETLDRRAPLTSDFGVFKVPLSCLKTWGHLTLSKTGSIKLCYWHLKDEGWILGRR